MAERKMFNPENCKFNICDWFIFAGLGAGASVSADPKHHSVSDPVDFLSVL